MPAQNTAVVDLQAALTALQDLGFGTDDPINAGDAVDAVNAIYRNMSASGEAAHGHGTRDAQEIPAAAALDMLRAAFRCVGIGSEDDVDGADLIDAINEVWSDVCAAGGLDDEATLPNDRSMTP